MTLSADERAAVRSYLQRSEVRLSTVHRTVTALLSGAGVLVLLPAVGRDSVVNVMRSLLSSSDSAVPITLTALVVLTLTLAFIVIWLLLLEITRFYFHANHFTSERGTTFSPRFTLTSLHLPVDELTEESWDALQRHRADPGNVDLLVPANVKARRHIDAQVAAYEGLPGNGAPTDATRAAALLQLAGVKDRSLLDEVAKVEYGMARHVTKVQVIVLRYIKALLVVLTTTISTFVMAAAVETTPAVDESAQRWIVAALVLWAPAVLFVTSSPVRWLGQILMTEGATAAGIRYDKDLTRLERVASVFSLVVLVGGLICGAVLLTHNASTAGTVALAIACGTGCLAEVVLLRQIRA